MIEINYLIKKISTKPKKVTSLEFFAKKINIIGLNQNLHFGEKHDIHYQVILRKLKMHSVFIIGSKNLE